jgi:hypothetical protein
VEGIDEGRIVETPMTGGFIIATVGERRKLLSAAVPATLTASVGACASVRWNPLLGGSARSQGGLRWVSVVSEAHDQGPQPVPRYLSRINGRARLDGLLRYYYRTV